MLAASFNATIDDTDLSFVCDLNLAMPGEKTVDGL
jgi:hypothetical protein